jgi:integrase
VKGYFQSLIEHKTLPGPNPASDLSYFAQALWPRWAPFILTGLLVGLRWGESAALYASDVDWERGWIYVQRTCSVKNWTPEQRKLMFPTLAGQIVRHGHFYENLWQPLLSKAGLPHRKYHAPRHSYATWILDKGTDVGWVQAQLGHATIAQTVDTDAHLDTARHAAGAEALTRYLTP